MADIYTETMLAWDSPAEDRKAQFMHTLYDFYKPEDHTFTGLADRFKNDVFDYVRGLSDNQDLGRLLLELVQTHKTEITS